MAERELLDITSLQRTIRLGDLYTRKGKISKIMGLMVEATGLECNMGDICRIQSATPWQRWWESWRIPFS